MTSSNKLPKLTPEEQSARFIEAAKRHETDDDPDRFKATVQRLAKAPASKNADKPKQLTK